VTRKLLFQAISKYVLGLLIIAFLLFLPAGTLQYWNGWLFIGILFIPMFIVGIVMMLRSPELLQKRLDTKEKEKEQKVVIALSGIMLLAAFVFAGLNFRFNWMILPNWIVYTATGIFLASYLMYTEVLRENEYLLRTVSVQENQKVIDTGLYGIIRHPMYSATLGLFLSMGLVLGSLISFLILLCYIPIIAKRIMNEEKVMLKELEGYADYKKKVKFKVIPLIW
jgi:protein-S-isoprenylcysteine O-methyltransferase Ste14